MKVSLVAPPSVKGKYEHNNLTIPKVGIGYIAAVLEHNGINCSILDGRFERLDMAETVARLVIEQPDLIGISSMTPDIMASALLATEIKHSMPDCTIVIGGAHAIALPVETLEEFDSFDILISGEGEVTMLELVQALRDNKPLDDIGGIVYRKDGNILSNPPREWIEDLDSLPFPAWDKYPRKSPVYYLISVRGCPFRCAFCMRSMGSKPRKRSPENVVKEIEWLIKEHQAKEFIFIDETFVLDRKRIIRLLKMLIDRKIPDHIKWVAQTRVDHVDEDIFRLMRAAGCYKVEFGIESGNQTILDGVQKGTRLEQAVQAVQAAKASGLKVGCSFILGHPNETRSSIQDTIDLLVKLNPDNASVGMMIPHPGTRVYEMAINGENKYRLENKNWSEFIKFGGSGLEIEGLPRREIRRLQAKAYMSFYLKNGRIIDFLTYAYQHSRQALVVAKKLFSNDN